MQPLLQGEVASPKEDVELLRRKIQRLEGDLQDAREALAAERQKSVVVRRAMGTLQGVLQPLYNGLKSIYGEFDAAGVEESATPKQASTPRTTAVWESWKQKLPGKPAEFIQALLEHGHPMSSEQLRVATHSGASTVPQIIYKLNKCGLINKNGGKFSLKEL